MPVSMLPQLWIPQRGLDAAAIEQTEYIGFLIKQRQHELYQSSTWGPDFAALLWFEELFTITKTWCAQVLGCLQDQPPSVEKQVLVLNMNILGLVFPPQIPLPPSTVYRGSYKKKRICLQLFYEVQKHQVSKQYTKYLTIWLQNFMGSRWGFWKRQQHVYPLWHSKESCGHPGQLFIICV